MNQFLPILSETWHFLLEASPYILFGLLVSGLLRVFLAPQTVATHFGQGRYRSVFKAAFLGIPIPLCSCGVLPAAAAFKKQGANNGATAAFLISTPESGVDSMAITYALIDPIMTVARPLVGFVTAAVAGIAENLLGGVQGSGTSRPDLSCQIDGCCDGLDCPPEDHSAHHGLGEKLVAGMRFAFTTVWADLAGWFWVGLLLAGLLVVLVPDRLFAEHLGSGLPAMLLMLLVGMPFYMCATASTPIAAGLILKGASPGAALVFLLAGPATNITSLTVLLRILGRRATGIYLLSIASVSVLSGLLLDKVYATFGISAHAIVGQAGELVPPQLQWPSAIFLVLISIPPLLRKLRTTFARPEAGPATGCGCPGHEVGEPEPVSGRPSDSVNETGCGCCPH